MLLHSQDGLELVSCVATIAIITTLELLREKSRPSNEILQLVNNQITVNQLLANARSLPTDRSQYSFILLSEIYNPTSKVTCPNPEEVVTISLGFLNSHIEVLKYRAGSIISSCYQCSGFTFANTFPGALAKMLTVTLELDSPDLIIEHLFNTRDIMLLADSEVVPDARREVNQLNILELFTQIGSKLGDSPAHVEHYNTIKAFFLGLIKR